MTLATKITLLRFFLIPLFAFLFISYISTPLMERNETLRLGAAAVFLFAALSDWIDGLIARRLNQQSRLGAILDPLADKGLLLTAVILLSWTQVSNEWRLPLWFPILIISRDIMVFMACVVLYLLLGKLEIKPSGLGKVATALQMITLLIAMLRPPLMSANGFLPFSFIVILTGVITILSFVLYAFHTVRNLNASGHTTSIL